VWRRLLLLLTGAILPLSQSAVTFQFARVDLGQLTKVIDSTGLVVDYICDLVRHILQINRLARSFPGALLTFGSSPQHGGSLSNVTISDQGFSTTPSANIVMLSGIAATVVSASVTTLIVSIPTNTATGPISVTVGGGTSTSTRVSIAGLPVISSITPSGALQSTLATTTVIGINLSGLTLMFSPSFAPSAAAINSAGTSATLGIATSAIAKGRFVLLATTAAGSSTPFPPSGNYFSIASSSTAIDSDGNGLSDAQEIILGTDPLDADSFSDGVEVTSGSDLLNPACTPLNCRVAGREAESMTFSIVNALPPSGGFTEADSITFSLINTVALVGGFTEADSQTFSVCNSATAVGLGFTHSSTLPELSKARWSNRHAMLRLDFQLTAHAVSPKPQRTRDMIRTEIYDRRPT
jgi:hypothetical protein